MAGKRAKQLNWSASRRNEFIEFRVFWHGRINRADLMDTFGISLQQASLAYPSTRNWAGCCSG